MDTHELIISVITVNLNNKAGLTKTIDSVARQSYDHIEYIVIDGASTDGSVDILRENEKKMACWISEPDKGVYQAMNKGIDRATGDYLFFLNSGDYFADDTVIEKFVSLRPDADVVYGDIYLEKNGNLRPHRYPEKITMNFLYVRSLCHQATFFKSYLFQQYGKYDEGFRIVSDWQFCLNLYLNTPAVFKKIDLTISVFNNDGISGPNTDIELHRSERKSVIEALLPQFCRVLSETGVRYNLPVSMPVKLITRMRNLFKPV